MERDCKGYSPFGEELIFEGGFLSLLQVVAQLVDWSSRTREGLRSFGCVWLRR